MTNEENKKDPSEEGSESTSIVQQNNQPVNIEALLMKAVEQNVSVDTLERLMAIRREVQTEQAKRAFDEALANFQAECPTIVKTKVVRTDSGAEAYRYAPIESIVEQVKDALQNNGFSYSTEMEMLPNGVKVAVKVTHSAGHSETTHMTVPLGNRTKIMSESQQVAAASTFAKRYAFCNAFGILTGDEDNDAQTVSDKPVVVKATVKPVETIGEIAQAYVQKLNEANTKEAYAEVSKLITTAHNEGLLNSAEWHALSEAAKTTVKRIQEIGLPPKQEPEPAFNDTPAKAKLRQAYGKR